MKALFQLAIGRPGSSFAIEIASCTGHTCEFVVHTEVVLKCDGSKGLCSSLYLYVLTLASPSVWKQPLLRSLMQQRRSWGQ